MISCMVGNAFFGLNALPVNSSMYWTIFPQTLMTGTTIEFNKHWKIEMAHTPRHTKNPSHETPRNPAQNLIYALHQQETSTVPTGPSTSVQDSSSNNVPSTLSPPGRMLLTAYTRSPTLTTRILISFFKLPWKSHPIWRHPQRRQWGRRLRSCRSGRMWQPTVNIRSDNTRSRRGNSRSDNTKRSRGD